MNDITVRKASSDDAEVLSELIHRLADFENMSDECTATPESVAAMMNEPNGLEGFIAVCGDKIIGMAAYSLYRLATFSGKRVLYLEDFYVLEEYRGTGAGSLLFDSVRNEAERLGCRKIEWKCLEWNKNAASFYDRKGGECSSEWLNYTIML